ncbi:MAG TPA: hypothetical protein PKA37_16885, partial [Planctomycetota bacterium]|nr:hypothetical protein [Planctomycetota bacterium]
MHQPNESRRTFLRSAAHGLVAAQLSPLLFAEARAASPNLLRRGSKNTLVCIYLRGGADALNVVIPYTNQNYYTLRPTISIPPEKTEDDLGVIKLNDHFGLHPALAPLQPLWDQKRLVPILPVGSPHPTRS